MKRKKGKTSTIKKTNPRIYEQGGLVDILSTGSDIAMASGNPYAMLAGSAFKGIQTLTGNFGEQDKMEAEQKKLMREQQLIANKSRSMATIGNFPLQGTTRAGVFRKYGGKLYEQGGTIQTSNGGQGIPLSSGGQMLVGNSHEQGGIDMVKGQQQLGEAEGGETISTLADGSQYVGSVSVINPQTGNMFATDIAKAELQKGNIERRANKRLALGDGLAKNMVKVKQSQIDGLAQAQEQAKQTMIQEQQIPQDNQFQFGGTIPKDTLYNPMEELNIPNMGGEPQLYGVGTPVTPNAPSTNTKGKLGKGNINAQSFSNIASALPINTLGTLVANSKLNPPPARVLESSVQLPTVRKDAQLAEIASNISGARTAMGRNRSQSQANATLASLVSAGSREANTVLQNVDAQNAQIRAQQVGMNVGIQGRNTGSINQSRKENVQFDNQKVTNVLNAVNRDLLQGKVNMNAKNLEELQQTNNMIDLALSDPRIAKEIGLTEAELKVMKEKALKAIMNKS